MSFLLYADKNKLYRKDWEAVTSGSVNVFAIRYQFSADWDGLTKTVVFKAEGTSVEVPLDEDNGCIIPWEVLTKHGVKLYMRTFKPKLTSRKFLSAAAGIVTGLAMVFGLDENTISTVAGTVASVASVVTYILAEGRIDAEGVKNTIGNEQDATENEQDSIAEANNGNG